MGGLATLGHRGPPPPPLNFGSIPCYEYHLCSSEGQVPEYIHVQEGENIQRTPWRNTIIEKANTYLIASLSRPTNANKDHP
jgi:hypothetical protein